MKTKRLADLRRRLAVSCLSLAVLAFFIVYSQLYIVNFLLAGLVAVLVAVGVWEYLQLAKATGLEPAFALPIGVSVAFVITFYLSTLWPFLSPVPVIVLILGAVLFFLFHFQKMPHAISHIAIEFFGVCYVAVPLSFILKIINYPVQGQWWIVYLIVVTKITDVAAYFAGRLAGKHYLAPVLSPKKTVEGAVAGFVFAVAASFAFYKFSPLKLSLVDALWMGLAIGILAQIGDLAESLLKRDADVKDSNTLPGLGGVLDMVDSLLLTTPIVYFYL
jgi:phosphatidate cytidylyltransferase